MSRPANKTSQRAVAALLASLSTAIALALFAANPAWLASADWWLFDRLASQAAGMPDGDRVAVVEIDDRSLKAYGRWPWPRRRLAALVNALAAGEPAAIGMEVMFPEESEDDEVLARSLRAARVVAGYYFDMTEGNEEAAPCAQHPLNPALAPGPEDRGQTWLYNAPGAVCNVEPIANALTGSGFLNASPDPDGVMRRVPLLIAHRGSVYPGLALATVLAAEPAKQIALRRNEMGHLDFRMDSRVFHLDSRASLLPPFQRSGRYRHVSAADVLARPEAAAGLRGKIVFLGLTARGLGSWHVTNVHPEYAGVDIHAGAAGSLLDGDAFSPIESAHLWELLLLVTLGGGSAALAGIGRLRPALAAGLLPLAAMAVLTPLVFFQAGVCVSPFLTIGAGAGNAAAGAAIYGLARRQRNLERARKIAAANEFMLAALASLTALRDVETGGHLIRVQLYLRQLCGALRESPRFRTFLTEERVALLIAVAPIHDIGKIGIPDEVLQKNGPLTEAETDLIRQHVLFGRQVLERAKEMARLDDPELFQMCKDIVYSHHERWDGTGYPRGLRGDEIPVAARLVAIADVYDALVSHRVYKPAYSHTSAMETIEAGRGTHFDPEIVNAFVANAESFRRLYEEHRDNGGPE